MNKASDRAAQRGGLLAAIVLLLVALGTSRPGMAAPRTGATVTYPAGWNLVALPTAQLLSQALPPLYAFGPGGGNYEQIGLGDAVGGRAVWAYFPQAVTITLGASASEYTRVLTQPDQWTMVGDPSTSESLRISGTDAAVTYDATLGYVAADELRPGQGAWVLSHAGGAVFIGVLPSASGEAAVQSAQVSLSQDPTNRNTIDGVSSATGEMITNRQYAAAQSASDDLRAADDDGLRGQGVSQLPPLSEAQRSDAATVREDLARAQTASTAGDTATADSSVDDARRAAQASEDSALDDASAQSTSSSVLYAASTPANTTRAGRLLRATFLKVGLGMPPSPTVWNAVTLLLAGQPVPSRNPTATATPTIPPASAATAPTVAAINCSPLAVNVNDSVECSAEIHGTVTAITWTASGGSPSTGNNIRFGTSYSSAGSYTIKVQACNGSACASMSATITVSGGGSTITTPPPTTTQSPFTLSGPITISEQDIGCSFSAMPLTQGSITMTFTPNSGQASGGANGFTISGTLQGSGHGSRQVTCGTTTGTLTWSASYTGDFSGTSNPVTGAINLTGSIHIQQTMNATNCFNSSSSISCTQPGFNPSPTYTLHVSGSMSPQGNSTSGTIVIDSGCSTTGQWQAG